MNFKIKKFYTTFHHDFYVKNGNFNTRDSSPLIERVLASWFEFKSAKASRFMKRKEKH